MCTRFSNQHFVDLCRQQHGDLYDYSLIEYKNAHTPVKVICKVHGVFSIQARLLKSGSGCQQCVTESKSNKDSFIINAKKVHGDRYDYSLAEYINNQNPIKIICSVHGVFEQAPTAHINKGFGCKKCSTVFKDDNASFIKKSIIVHGNKYDYSLVDYKKTNKTVVIICKKHGEFTQKPDTHLRNHGCPTCGHEKKQKRTTKQWINNAKLIHGDTYDYSKVIYADNNKQIIITCRKHGDFSILPRVHNSGAGCNRCAIEINAKKATKGTEAFINEANKAHKNKYSYTKTVYKRTNLKLIITCNVHGDFNQSPNKHLIGQGCKLCNGTGGFNNKKSGYLYYIKITKNGEEFYKIGITNRSVKERFASNYQYIKVLKLEFFNRGISARSKERIILDKYRDFRCDDKALLPEGNTEIFVKDVLNLDNKLLTYTNS